MTEKNPCAFNENFATSPPRINHSFLSPDRRAQPLSPSMFPTPTDFGVAGSNSIELSPNIHNEGLLRGLQSPALSGMNDYMQLSCSPQHVQPEPPQPNESEINAMELHLRRLTPIQLWHKVEQLESEVASLKDREEHLLRIGSVLCILKSNSPSPASKRKLF
eukprot:c13206_g1_i1.p1 GENE.c13206_g1_i1~~c13206_g1_i1.p1  ORF type:complete len:182 (+),score=40.99 c13206_g1_i1:63-548(+)